MKKALTAYEDFNMYGGAHVTNYKQALKAAKEGRGLIIHGQRYDGQRYNYYDFRVRDLVVNPDGSVTGVIEENGEAWKATSDLCEYAKTGKMS